MRVAKNKNINFRGLGYYPFGMEKPGRTFSSGEYKYGYNGKEKDNEVSGDGNSYDYGFRIYNPRIAKFLSVDPLTTDYPSWSPYPFAMNSPISGVDLDGLEYYYAADGKFLGNIGTSDDVYTADKIEEQTVENEDCSTSTNKVAVNAKSLNIKHTEFQKISYVIKNEGVTSEANEYLYIAHASNNNAKNSKVSLYDKLMYGFSSVPNKTTLGDDDKTNTANYARAGAISVLSGNADPTNGGSFWDGTDFIAWGLESPDKTPQNKFEEYKSIAISKTIYDTFLASQKAKYTKGTVSYSGTAYTLPAKVFTDNAQTDGSFLYTTDVKKYPKANGKLVATGTAGLSIFWKKE
ncbi:MAG: hypothetical protein A3F91_03690 [Flavobacteria bacterium RIFCSPLOWO2_12_FULL_35_11]|nr:MAG: hypothetical protein A3F91_03690 [Flavobacteria bacterium RIFCSPLOWO2_12_FULL_35_11]